MRINPTNQPREAILGFNEVAFTKLLLDNSFWYLHGDQPFAATPSTTEHFRQRGGRWWGVCWYSKSCGLVNSSTTLRLRLTFFAHAKSNQMGSLFAVRWAARMGLFFVFPGGIEAIPTVSPSLVLEYPAKQNENNKKKTFVKEWNMEAKWKAEKLCQDELYAEDDEGDLVVLVGETKDGNMFLFFFNHLLSRKIYLY